MEKYGSIHVARLTVAIYSILYRLYSRKKYGRTGCDCLACRRSVTRLSQRLLPNVVLKFYQIRFFFTKHVQIPRFEISGCVPAWAACSNCSHVFTCYTLFGLFHGDSITKPSNNHVNIISNTFLDMKATILDKTLETIPANITKLLNIDKTNFVSPSPPVQCCEQRRNNFW